MEWYVELLASVLVISIVINFMLFAFYELEKDNVKFWKKESDEWKELYYKKSKQLADTFDRVKLFNLFKDVLK